MIEILVILYAAATFAVAVFLTAGIIAGYRDFFWCVVFLIFSPITLMYIFSKEDKR